MVRLIVRAVDNKYANDLQPETKLREKRRSAKAHEMTQTKSSFREHLCDFVDR